MHTVKYIIFSFQPPIFMRIIHWAVNGYARIKLSKLRYRSREANEKLLSVLRIADPAVHGHKKRIESETPQETAKCPSGIDYGFVISPDAGFIAVQLLELAWEALGLDDLLRPSTEEQKEVRLMFGFTVHQTPSRMRDEDETKARLPFAPHIIICIQVLAWKLCTLGTGFSFAPWASFASSQLHLLGLWFLTELEMELLRPRDATGAIMRTCIVKLSGRIRSYCTEMKRQAAGESEMLAHALLGYGKDRLFAGVFLHFAAIHFVHPHSKAKDVSESKDSTLPPILCNVFLPGCRGVYHFCCTLLIPTFAMGCDLREQRKRGQYIIRRSGYMSAYECTRVSMNTGGSDFDGGNIDCKMDVCASVVGGLTIGSKKLPSRSTCFLVGQNVDLIPLLDVPLLICAKFAQLSCFPDESQLSNSIVILQFGLRRCALTRLVLGWPVFCSLRAFSSGLSVTKADDLKQAQIQKLGCAAPQQRQRHTSAETFFWIVVDIEGMGWIDCGVLARDPIGLERLFDDRIPSTLGAGVSILVSLGQHHPAANAAQCMTPSESKSLKSITTSAGKTRPSTSRSQGSSGASSGGRDSAGVSPTRSALAKPAAGEPASGPSIPTTAHRQTPPRSRTRARTSFSRQTPTPTPSLMSSAQTVTSTASATGSGLGLASSDAYRYAASTLYLPERTAPGSARRETLIVNATANANANAIGNININTDVTSSSGTTTSANTVSAPHVSGSRFMDDRQGRRLSQMHPQTRADEAYQSHSHAQARSTSFAQSQSYWRMRIAETPIDTNSTATTEPEVALRSPSYSEYSGSGYVPAPASGFSNPAGFAPGRDSPPDQSHVEYYHPDAFVPGSASASGAASEPSVFRPPSLASYTLTHPAAAAAQASSQRDSAFASSSSSSSTGWYAASDAYRVFETNAQTVSATEVSPTASVENNTDTTSISHPFTHASLSLPGASPTHSQASESTGGATSSSWAPIPPATAELHKSAPHPSATVSFMDKVLSTAAASGPSLTRFAPASSSSLHLASFAASGSSITSTTTPTSATPAAAAAASRVPEPATPFTLLPYGALSPISPSGASGIAAESETSHPRFVAGRPQSSVAVARTSVPLSSTGSVRRYSNLSPPYGPQAQSPSSSRLAHSDTAPEHERRHAEPVPLQISLQDSDPIGQASTNMTGAEARASSSSSSSGMTSGLSGPGTANYRAISTNTSSYSGAFGIGSEPEPGPSSLAAHSRAQPFVPVSITSAEPYEYPLASPPSGGPAPASASTSTSAPAPASSSGQSTRKRNHACWMCHKSFDRPSTLRKHLLVHTGEKASGPLLGGGVVLWRRLRGSPKEVPSITNTDAPFLIFVHFISDMLIFQNWPVRAHAVSPMSRPGDSASGMNRICTNHMNNGMRLRHFTCSFPPLPDAQLHDVCACNPHNLSIVAVAIGIPLMLNADCAASTSSEPATSASTLATLEEGDNMAREQTNPDVRRSERERDGREVRDDEQSPPAPVTPTTSETSAHTTRGRRRRRSTVETPLSVQEMHGSIPPDSGASTSQQSSYPLRPAFGGNGQDSGEVAVATASSSTGNTEGERRPKRRRRAPSPSRWVPPSLRTFSLSPVRHRTSTPLPPVSPGYDAATGTYEERDSYATIPDENVDPASGEAGGESSSSSGGNVAQRSRAERLHNFEYAPYHPCGWTGRLPGPAVVGSDLTNYTKPSYGSGASGSGAGSGRYGGNLGGGLSFMFEYNLAAAG
ncbi:uncharacterized protein FOMMEDRAFT_146449 [Fomitiporia mediterranea MF3/22]|uniref:uncharacterized protein n=1 Tax=Fomitiporia mediterranea (strain MF3/22) TaxID=694068 RepID=UPI0004408F46|nr:uncharacterized protein FOMMEDRAFT_146449 [Fomitiporia mediterranea MF3/22]EJD04568.1 hypothetical protein FOMMEDRAFT_146449 [Fomitiporia mediterranea MF3/22]